MDRRLFTISDVFSGDAPHLKGRIDATGIQLIDPQVPLRIRSAARRLTDSIHETLDSLPVSSTNREIVAACQRVSMVLQSDEFAHGLKRIVAQRFSWKADEFVADLDRFDVCPATSIDTSLYLERADADPMLVGGGSVQLFFDNDGFKIWIATASPRRIAIELARAIDGSLGDFGGIDLAALEDMLRVTQVEEIEELLDDRRIPSLMESDLPSFDWSDSSQDATTDQGAADHDVRLESELDPDLDHSQAEGQGNSGPNRSTGEQGAGHRTRVTAGRSGNGSRPTASRPAGSATPRSPRPATDDQPPIAPGDGAARSSGTAGGQRGDGRSLAPAPASGSSRSQKRGRFVTYVAPETSSEPDSAHTDTSEHDLETGKLAVEHVLAFERREGRSPREMPHLNPGYDVVSSEPDGRTRYIEVKGMNGEWNKAGVGISRRQFAFATSKSTESWLYVVEHVRSANPKVFAINDPAGRVSHFYYDIGWRTVATDGDALIASSSEELKKLPVVGDQIVLLDGEVVEVRNVEKHGQISRLTVTAANGDNRTVIWRPGMTIENQEEL